MNKYELIDEKHVLPTPAGIYYATSSNQSEVTRKLLLAMVSQSESQRLTMENLCGQIKMDEDSALETLHRMQRLGWLETHEQAQQAPSGSIEDIFPPLLRALSSTGKTLLADQQGFNLASNGFTHEAAEELSALSADIASLRLRHGNLLFKNLSIKTHAFGLVDAAGNSQLGFWPLYIGDSYFTLAMSGVPRFNQSDFTNLVWALTHRYATSVFEPSSLNNDSTANSEEAVINA